MEIERKFTVRSLPEHLEEYPQRIIEQAYLNTAPVVRIRRDNNDYYMTYKGGGMLEREEYNLPLDAASYAHLLEKADGIILTKTRFVIPIDEPHFIDDFIPNEEEREASLAVELDVFEGSYKGIVIAEVEFPTKRMAEAFLPLPWFYEDVTYDGRYHNSAMSRGIIFY